MAERIEVLQLPQHEQRLAAARRRAGWEIGDPSWANTIIAAYLDPDGDSERLTEEMES